MGEKTDTWTLPCQYLGDAGRVKTASATVLFKLLVAQ